jgi:hypothetical protein
MPSHATAEKIVSAESGQVKTPFAEKSSVEEHDSEHVITSSANVEYNNDEEQPEIHARTFVALAAMFLLNLVQLVALQGPPAVVRLDHSPDHTAERN